MRLPLAWLILGLVLAIPTATGQAAPVDETYVKQGGSAWGQLFKRYFPAAGEFGKSYALVIGVGDYDHYSTLRAPARDALRVRDFLRDEAGFDHIVTLTDEAATPERINRLMDVELPRLVTTNDRFLFYFSGHGTTRGLGGDDKRGYLVLKSASEDEWDRMIAMPRVLEWAGNFSSVRHVLFLLDACFSGLAATQAKSDGHRDQTLERLMDPAHLLVTAGTEDQKSYTVGDSSLFTTAFFEAVDDPAADFTRDGIVSLDEIEIYVKDRLDRERSRGLDMTPTRWKTRNANNAGDFFFLSPAYLNSRAGNPPDSRLDKGEPVQSKGPVLPDLQFEPVEQEARITARTAVREAPSSQSRLVQMLDKGALVYVPERVLGQPWARIEQDGRSLGFVLDRNLGPPEPVPPVATVPDMPVGVPVPAPPDPAAAEKALSLTVADWRAIQRDLATLGLLSGPADGVPGPRTRAAVGAWRASRGEPPAPYLEAADIPLLKAEAAAQPPARPAPGTTLRDCPDCPEMVVIPAGRFMMGSPDGEEARESDEGPRHAVTIPADFAVGRYEVTFDEWDACARAGACRPVEDKWGRGRQPVINVSWGDARTYVAWLGESTGKPYRLPSEAEWEYAARAGTDTPFWTGRTISTKQANFDGNFIYGPGAKGVYREKTVVVDDSSFPANPFGLSHVHGNVWEWVEDCGHRDYTGAPADGSAWTADCSGAGRVARGGSWDGDPGSARSAFRNRVEPGLRLDLSGFRVARTLTP